MKHLPYALPVIAACLLCGCITSYTPSYIEGHRSLLVVEGIISDGETTVRLSRSVGLDSQRDTLEQLISGAQVWIESENGGRFDALESASGEYIAAGVTLSDDTRYRLRISLDDREYESSYRHPRSTPLINDIDFHLKGDDGPVQVRLDVLGEGDNAGYYMWSYKETWEIYAPVAATHYYGVPGDITQYYSIGTYFDRLRDSDPYNNLSIEEYPQEEYPNGLYFYCWKYYSSREFLLGSTERLSENRLTDHVLYEFGASDDRLSYLYHTKISQFSIGEDAYYYFSNIKKNTDETGSIFAPVPSEMQGNVVCTTSPDIPVIGFVEVSKGVDREVFLNSGDSPYRRPFYSCKIRSSLMEIEENFESPSHYFLVNYDSLSPINPMTINRCIDCRLWGGSKSRPGWWPNDHL